MKKLLSRSLIKPLEQRGEHDGSPPVRAASLPVRQLLPSSPRHSTFNENAASRDAETPRLHRPTKPCTNEQCQSTHARLQHQLKNLMEEKSQLESLIQMQQQTLRRIDEEGRNSEELAARQLKVQNKLALVLQDEKTTLRQLLAARNAEAEKMFSELRELREADSKARDASKEDAVRLAEANAELQSLRKRLTELEEQAMKAEPLMRLGSPEKLVSLVTRNTELVGELAAKEESVSCLKRQLTETQAHAEDAVREKDAELQSLRERFAELEEQAMKAEPLMRLGSPEKLASLVTRNTELVGELAAKEESVSCLKRQLTETQAHAEDAVREKDAELQSLRERFAELEEQAMKAEPLMRLGSPEKLASLVTRNTELVGELAAKEESVSCLKRQLTETQAHAEDAVREKDAELQSLRERFAELEEQVMKAEPLMRLGSPEKLASLVTRNEAVREKDAELQSLRERFAELEEQVMKAEPLMRLGSPEKLASLVKRNELTKEKNAEMQSLRERLSDLEEQVTKAEPLIRLGSPETLASLVTRNTELVGELAEKEESVSRLKQQLTEIQAHAEEAAQERDAKLQSLRERLADLEQQATKAEALLRLGSPGELASLITRNTELVGELAEQEESVSSLKRQLTETRKHAEEKDAELQSLRTRLADSEEQATKAKPLIRLGSPEKLASLVTRNMELVGELAEREESMLSLKRQLTENQRQAEEAAKEKDAAMQTLRERVAELEEQATKAESFIRLGSPGKLGSLMTRKEATREEDAELQGLRKRLAASEKQATNAELPRPLGLPQKLALLVTQNTELVPELAMNEESVSSLKRQLVETQAHAEEAAKEKDAELESLRKRLAELERQAEADQRMQFDSRQKSTSSRTRSALKARSRPLLDASEGEHALQEQKLEQEKFDQTRHVTQEEASGSARLLREAHEVELRLQRQLQHVQCELEKMKKENHTLKETLMNTAQQSVDKERAISQDRKEYENLMRSLQVATRDRQDCKYLLEMEKERRIAEVTRLRRQLQGAHQKLREQQLLRDMQQDQDLNEDCSSRGLCSSPAEGLRHNILKEVEVSKAVECAAVAVTSSLPKTVWNRDLADRSSSDVIRLLRMFGSHDAGDGLLKASCSIF
ncbi:hypothetical protein Emag_004827 [Eimeria magna]